MSTRLSYCLLLVCALAVGLTGAARGADYTIPITSAISQAALWPDTITIPLTDPVTKDHYWTTANTFYTTQRSGATYWTAQATPYLNISLYLNYGMWISYMYAINGQAADAELAAKCVEYAKRCMVEYPSNSACQPGAEATRILWLIHTCLTTANYPKPHTGSSYYTAQHQQWVRDMAVDANPSFAVAAGWAKEYGSFNRSFGCALNGECLLALYPTAPDATLWRTYIDTVWNYWWTYKDNDESTDHYNALWFRYLLQWIEVRNCQTQFWSNAGVKRMMDRYLYQVQPLGAFPNYGDSCGWSVSWGHWVYLFEACATQYNDARYKWAAHRIYNYAVNRIETLTSWSETGEQAGWSLLNAWAMANDTLGESAREKDVALTKRHRIVQRTDAEAQATKQTFDLYTELQPDKMVFTSGSDRDSLSLTLDAIGEAGHSHKKSPMTIAMSDHQSLLMMALGYMERLPEDHHRPLVMDFDGYPYDSIEYHQKSNNDRVSQANVYELGGIGYGKIQVTQYLGYPANLDRDVVFIKGVGAVVKDMVTFTSLTGASDIWLRWGSMYRVANLGPDYGANWANTYIGEWIPLRGLGVNAPVYTRWKNSKRDLLIYFLEHDNGTMEVVDHKQWDSTITLPWRLQYSIRQTAQPNVPVSATTLLLPHASGPAQTLAEGVTVHLDDALKTVFSFTGEDGALHSVIINRSGAAVSAGGLETDGQIAYVKRVSGTVTSVARYGGTYVRVNSVDKTSMAAASKEQMVPEALSDVQVAVNPASPIEAENPITITATPTGGTMVQYQFQAGYGGGNWSTIQAYSSSNTCVWTPTAGHDYTIRVWAKEGDSTNQYDVQRDVAYTVTEPVVVNDGMILSTPVVMYSGSWNNNLREAMEPLGYTVCMGTSYAVGNTIGFDTNNTTAARYDLNTSGEFPTTATVQNGAYSNKPSWWTFGTGGSTVVTPNYGGGALCWSTTHYALPLLSGNTSTLPKSCVITIVPNVTQRTTKKIAVLLTTSNNTNAFTATVDYIKIGNFSPNAMFPLTVSHPGGVAYGAVANGFQVPVIPGKNIEIRLTLNSAINVGVALAIDDVPEVKSLGAVTSAPVVMRTDGQWNSDLSNTMGPLGYPIGIGTGYIGGNTIGIDWDPSTASARWDLDANGYFPSTAAVGPSTTKPSWWTFNGSGSKVVSPGYTGHAPFCWNTRHYGLPLLDGDTNNLPRSCTVTIVPNVTTPTTKKIAIIPVSSVNGSASSVTVNHIKVGNYPVPGIFPLTVTLPSGNPYGALPYGFEVPVQPGRPIEINFTLNAATNVGVAMATQN